MTNSQVSVILPCYNVGAFVKKAIDSILNQTYPNLEIWLIDDASTDNTREILEKYDDKRIMKIFFDVNTQKVGAVNEVLKKVNGDFVCFQDADDYSEPRRIELQVQEFLKKPGLGVCFTKYKRLNDNFIPSGLSLTNEELQHEFFNFFMRTDQNTDPTLCATMMISRLALQETKGYHPYFAGKVGEDSHWVYRILKKFKGAVINQPLYNYLYREGSFSQIQFSGTNPKYAYSWQLLALIIQKDHYENIDVLDEKNHGILKEIELKACENALIAKTQELNDLRNSFEGSNAFRVGKFITWPFRIIKKVIEN